MAKNIKLLPEYDRPYEKMELQGIYTLTDSELLAVIIRCGTKNANCIDISRTLLDKFDGKMSNVMKAGISELSAVEGVGRTKALQLAAVGEICRRIRIEQSEKTRNAGNPDAVGKMLMAEMGFLDHEIFKVFMLDKGLHIIGEKIVSEGIIDKALVHPREVFAPAIRELSYAIIIAHNHPGGSRTPSRDDIVLTNRIIDAGNILGIPVLDHFIVTGNAFFSMAQEGTVKFAA